MLEKCIWVEDYLQIIFPPAEYYCICFLNGVDSFPVLMYFMEAWTCKTYHD